MPWLNDCIYFTHNGFIIRQIAYNSYKDYVDELGADPDYSRSFYAKMRETPKVKECKMNIKDKLERVFKGISLKDLTEDDQVKLL